MSADRFVQAYQGTPPWDIGRPQPAFVALADAGVIEGPVLDAGCGTGENALFLAGRGLTVLGVDAVPAAIAAARTKAAERGLSAEFAVHDALDLGSLGRTFRTVVDSGLFHTFDDPEREQYVTALAAVLEPGGVAHVLCFSEHETREGGPRRVTQAELRAVFDRPPFAVRSIVAAEMATRLEGRRREAWLAEIRRGAGA